MLQRMLEMLRFHPGVDPDPLQYLARGNLEAGDPDCLALGQGVADPEAPVIGDADDVAGPGLLGELALARQKKHRGLHRYLASAADVLQFHAALKPARRDPHKGDAIAVLRVDI